MKKIQALFLENISTTLKTSENKFHILSHFSSSSDPKGSLSRSKTELQWSSCNKITNLISLYFQTSRQVLFTAHNEKALDELLTLGLEDHYILEDFESGSLQIGGNIHPIPNPKHSTLTATPTVDWEAQSASFAPGYKDGLIHTEYGFPMLPGPGFGDLSHPTTKLTIDALLPLVKGKHFLDLGCGSGVLSIAAALNGALSITAIDIDPEALTHTRANAKLNNIQIETSITLPSKLSQPLVIAMNMTLGDQKAVLAAYPHLLNIEATWVISGLIEGQNPIIPSLPATTLDGWSLFII